MEGPIIVSNRGISVSPEGHVGGGEGGLTKVLEDIIKTEGGVSISQAMSDDERTMFFSSPSMVFIDKDVPFTIRKLVEEDTWVTRGHYRFSNEFWWPLLHLTYEDLIEDKGTFFPTPQFYPRDLDNYVEINRRMADEVLSELALNPNRLIRFDDFHEFLAMKMVRDKYPDLKAPIGFFLHTPFFDYDLVKDHLSNDALEHLGDMVESLLSCDLVGFQIEDYRKKFIEFVQKSRGNVSIAEDQDQFILTDNATGHITRLGVYPVGVDPESIDRTARRNEGPRYGEYSTIARDTELLNAQGIETSLQIGRRDYTKGFPNGMRVIEELNMGENNSRLVTIASQSRPDIQAFQGFSTFLRSVDEEVNRQVRLKLPDGVEVETGYSVSSLYSTGIPYAEGLKLHGMKGLRLELILTDNDGMCLVVPETILARRYNPEGLIVLGRNGAANILASEGLGVNDGFLFVENPRDVRSIASQVAEIQRGMGDYGGPRLSDRAYNFSRRLFDVQKNHVAPFFRDLEHCRA